VSHSAFTHWRAVAKIVFRDRARIRSLAVASLATPALATLWPLMLQRMVDDASTHKPLEKIASFGGLCLLLVILEPLSASWRQKQVIHLGCTLEKHWSRRVSLHLLRQRLSGRTPDPGAWLQTFDHIKRIRDCLLDAAPNLVFGLGGSLVALAVISRIDGVIAFFIATITVATACAGRRSLARFHVLAEHYFRMDAQRQAVAAETVAALVSIKALGAESARHRLWDQSTDAHCMALANVSEHSRRFVLLSALCANILTLGVVGLGCIRALDGAITIGELFALQILAARVVQPVMTAAASVRQLHEANCALQQLVVALAGPTERAGPVATQADIAAYGIAARNISISYAPERGPAVSSLTFATPGQGLYAIVGSNGSGKTTLLMALLALAPHCQGDIVVGNMSVASQHPRKLRRRFGVVDQSPVLFAGSLAENLRVTASEASDQQLWQALDFVGLAEMFASDPKRLDFGLEPGGRNLSGGQRQRLAIARAILKAPAILALDEPTSAIDPEAALHLEEKLLSGAAAPLVLLVTHHLGVSAKADKIFVMNAGRLVGQGRHTELLSSCTHYATMWRSYLRNMTQSGAP